MDKKLAVVTGGAGFVGSHLCEQLVKEGYAVISLDNYFTGTPDNHVEGVVYRTGHTKDIFTKITEKPDIVFHLGEYARTEKSFEDIEYVWSLNKVGTLAVLEFCRRTQAKLVYAGSSTKFADGGDGKNQSPYAWSKASNTELIKNYGNWFDFDYVIVYFYNVYGPREMSGPYGTLIRIFTELTRQGQPLTITLPGTQTRNYTHVSDIVDGIILAAHNGSGDGYGIGADESYSVLEVAELFGGKTIFMPERKGNRLSGGVDNHKVKELGWSQNHKLEHWIENTKKEIGAVNTHEPRILVFSTTYLPDAGQAEMSLFDLMESLPNVQFDVITARFSKNEIKKDTVLDNVTVHYIGSGKVADKYLLPFLGAKKAKELKLKKKYIFQWSLFASYASLAALLSNSKRYKVPQLITLGDQKLNTIPWYARLISKYIMGTADQIHTVDAFEAQQVISFAKRSTLIKSIGEGDVFANQIRIAYTNFLKKRMK